MNVLGLLRNLAGRLAIIMKRSVLAVDRSSRYVLIELGSPREIRTLRQIMILFELAGYHVYLRAHLNRWTLHVGGILSWHKNAWLIWRSSNSVRPRTLVTDKFGKGSSSQFTSQKIIRLCYDYGPTLILSPGNYAFPETMHPQIYLQYQEHKRLEDYRTSKRQMRMLFAGNYMRTAYDNSKVRDLLGKLTRPQILDFLQAQELVRVISSQNELNQLLVGEYWNGLIWIDTNCFRIDQKDWLMTVARSDFFLCPPGVSSPLSHNSIEAMAVGTIPFINYPEWFFPNLIHQVNCITFSSLQDLPVNLQGILQMSDERIQTLRHEVIAYYSKNLSPQEFAGRLLTDPANPITLHLWEENAAALRRVL